MRHAPATGDDVRLDGVLVATPVSWVAPRLWLRCRELSGGHLFLLPEATLSGFEAGDRLRVEGTFYENSTLMRSVVQVSRIERR
jgi:hypothetical protein